MINETLYNKTVDILVQAYFNDTLQSGSWCGCAVGNIVAANNGIKIVLDEDGDPAWPTHAMCAKNWYGIIKPENLGPLNQNEKNNGLFQIESTGYSVEQITIIEHAFEHYTNFTTDWEEKEDKRMFNGLMAVIDVLDQIHGNTSPEVTQTAKRKFSPSVL